MASLFASETTLAISLSRRALLVSLGAAALAACRGKRVTNDVAARVVSLSPSTTETMFAVGAGDKLVGRSRYCDFPREVSRLPEVGGFVDPNYEAIVSLRPDLVIGARGPGGSSIADRLASRGIATYFPETESFDQIGEMILGIGSRVARSSDAQRVVQTIQNRAAAIQSALAAKAPPRVLFVFGIAPIVVAGPKSFADEMLTRAHGQNAVLRGPTYPTLSMENVLILDPDLILNASMAENGAADRISQSAPGWSSMRAVRTGRVALLSNDVVLRPGPRVADGLAVLARAIHPDAQGI